MLRDAIDDQGDVNRPVAATLGIFARPVDRIDDPHPRLPQPRAVARHFLREQAIVGPLATQRLDEESVRDPIAGVAQRRFRVTAALAQGDQPAPGLHGEPRGKIRICLTATHNDRRDLQEVSRSSPQITDMAIVTGVARRQ